MRLDRMLRDMARVSETARAKAEFINSPVPLNGSPTLLERLFSWVPSWKPSSEAHLREAEKPLLQGITAPYTDSYVPIGPAAVVRTFSINPVPEGAETGVDKLPLVMIHGFGAGFLQFHKNLNRFSSDRQVLAIDLPGFGRSTRVSFSNDPLRAEEQFVDCIERWRKQVGVERFILLGHSLGAFLACSYTIRHPTRVRHLVLVDPWGFDTAPSVEEFRKKMPWTGGVFWRVAASFKPFDAIRAAGPWGPDLVKRMRPDLERTFGSEFLHYIYHCNAQKPTGEAAYYNMQHFFGWAKRPMLTRLGTQMDPNIPLTLIYGAQSWMRHVDNARGQGVQACRPNSYVEVHWVDQAGHHVHADRPQAFNEIISEVCSMVDSGQDLDDPIHKSSSR